MMTAQSKAFAVVPKPVNRSTAYSPLSASWTLYRPERVASELGADEGAVRDALEKSGFSKAVRIREEIIRWKERLRKELQSHEGEIERPTNERTNRRRRAAIVREQLENVRNILRIPREDIPTARGDGQ